jgi:hypothetical protein
MAAIKLALFPPMLNKVKPRTWSALGKLCRNAANDAKSARFMA